MSWYAGHEPGMAAEVERSGMTYVCTVPPELGAVTKLEVKGGRVIARTESGYTMIVPQATEQR